MKFRETERDGSRESKLDIDSQRAREIEVE